MSTITPPRQFNVAEAADDLSLSTDAVYDLAANCQLKRPPKKPPKKAHLLFAAGFG